MENKLITLLALILSFFFNINTAYAYSLKTEKSNVEKNQWVPIQVSVLPNVKLFTGEKNVYGLRMSLLKSLDMNVYGLDFGLGINQVSKSVKGIQLAGLMNSIKSEDAILKDYNMGIQIAGLFNLIDNKFVGIQIAGLLNGASGFTGLQIGMVNGIAPYQGNGMQLGLLNFNPGGNIIGMQIGVLGNLSFGDVIGIQIGGLISTVDELKGHQIAPIKLSKDKIFGLQIAAINFSDSVQGAQFGLIGNFNKTIEGSQVGILNKADVIKGVQIGIINYCQKMYGMQLGVLNIIEQGTLPFFPLINASFALEN